MKRFLLGFCWLLVALGAAAVAAAVAGAAHAGEVFLESFKSTALGRDYAYTIYLPNGQPHS